MSEPNESPLNEFVHNILDPVEKWVEHNIMGTDKSSADVTLTIQDGYGHQTIYINDFRYNYLTVSIQNNSDQPITLNETSSVALTFDHSAVYFEALSIYSASASGSWNLTDTPSTNNPDYDHAIAFNINTGATITLGPSGSSTDSTSIVLAYYNVISSDTTAKQLSINVECQNFLINGTSQNIPLSCQLDFIEHNLRPIPLIAEFIGSRVVVNDGTSSSELRLRIQNTSREPLYFVANQSNFSIQFLVSDTDQTALCDSNQAGSSVLNIQLSGTASADWTLDTTKQSSGIIKLTPTGLSFLANGVLDIAFSGIVTNYTSGFVQFLVTAHRILQYGTQTLSAAVEKSPLSYDNSSTETSMSLSAGSLGSKSALNISGDSSTELVNIKQSGTGAALALNGSNSSSLLNINQSGTGPAASLTGNLEISGTLTGQSASFTGDLTQQNGKVYLEGQTAIGISPTGTQADPLQAPVTIGGKLQLIAGAYGDGVLSGWNSYTKTSHDLIGLYAGWDSNTIYIAGYYNQNGITTNNVSIGQQTGWFDLVNQRLGINTSSPSSTLDVNGDVSISGAFSGLGIVPIGSIIPYAGHDSQENPAVNLPPGWLLCNGQTVSRSTYAALYQVISDLYGSGDSSTTFNLPDYRGMFLRGVDAGAGNDPDSAARTAQVNQSGGSGSATGKEVGSRQADEFANHTHFYWQAQYTGGHGEFDGSSDWNSNQTTTGSNGGNETRPKNVYVNYLIRAL
jgi:hypothetical protein